MENWLTYELLLIQMMEQRKQAPNGHPTLADVQGAPRRGALRPVVAGALVRLGMLIDGAAGERAVGARGAVLEGERR